MESICEDPNILQENLRSKVANSPDFVGMAPEEALADLQACFIYMYIYINKCISFYVSM